MHEYLSSTLHGFLGQYVICQYTDLGGLGSAVQKRKNASYENLAISFLCRSCDTTGCYQGFERHLNLCGSTEVQIFGRSVHGNV